MKLSEKEYKEKSPYSEQKSGTGLFQLWDKDAEEWGPVFSAPNARIAILMSEDIFKKLLVQSAGLLEGLQIYQVATEYRHLPLNQEHIQGLVPLLIYTGIEYTLKQQREENKRIDNHITQQQD